MASLGELRLTRDARSSALPAGRRVISVGSQRSPVELRFRDHRSALAVRAQPSGLQHDGVMPSCSDLLAWTHPGQTELPPVVLLHGSGQDETSLLAFAAASCPGHTLLSVRGRIPWEGGYAFFRRQPDRTLDLADLALGAAAVRHLLRRLAAETKQLPILLGYSNGAIAAAAAVVDHRHLSAGAILLRPLSPSPERALARLDGFPVLLVSGLHDVRRRLSDVSLLDAQLTTAGAVTTVVKLLVGHGLTTADEDTVATWLRERSGGAAAP